ncbi:MAG: hypothetical protein HRU07_00210 [Nitrosopumilus sp.]|nr:hypothetical protein [Nitrosopumilus sp.]NRA04604.1 hypothetical protein [Nitrosopumilus sp.]
MNNEIGRKITSLTLMTIMLAGGMVIAAPGMVPAAHAANANLFVSAENSQFDNYMSGPQVIEVVVIDSDINDTGEAKGEPDVTVNGKILRMVQAVDGNWYGYFADRNMAVTADSTAVVAGTTTGLGLDFGSFCVASSGKTAVGIDLGNTVGFAIDDADEGGADGLEAGASGDAITASCTAVDAKDGNQNVLREAKEINGNVPAVSTNPVGVIEIAWPFIQLYSLNPTGNVIIQYNKGGGAQSVTLTFDTVDNFVSLSLDRSVYPQGSEVHITVTDLWLNIDPTDEDSWTFGTSGTISTNYQVFDENGAAVGNATSNTDANLLTAALGDLMCEDNCIMEFNPDVQSKGDVATIQDNDDTVIFITDASDGQDPASWAVSSGAFPSTTPLLDTTIPITITEQGPNSGVFGTYDESDTSVIIITDDAKRGTSASFTYNEDAYTILVGHDFGSVDIQPLDDEWNSGEEIPVEIIDSDANLNSRADEDLDLFNPSVKLIPSLSTGDPFTLGEAGTESSSVLQAVWFDNSSAGIVNGTLVTTPLTSSLIVNATVQKFSDRALLNTTSITTTVDSIAFDYKTTAADLQNTVLDRDVLRGFSLFNLDVRSLDFTGPFDAYLLNNTAGVIIGTNGTLSSSTYAYQIAAGIDAQSLTLLSNDTIDYIQSLPADDAVGLAIVATTGGFANAEDAVVADFFSFGFINDGLIASERIANQIIRIEAEESGDNTSAFIGSLEYIMINQLNILDPSTYTGLSPIADDPSFIVIEDLTDEDSPRVNYLDLGSDGVSTQVADQEEAPSHSGVVSFDSNSYKEADTVTITLEDLDLNVDSDLIDIYTTVTTALDANADVVGNSVTSGLSFSFDNGEQLGRLLDVTFDDGLWTSEHAGCIVGAGIDDGLGSTGFTLVETGTETGIFVGDFQIPAAFCRADGTTTDSESVTGLDIEVNYVDFRDASGEIIEVGDSAGIRANTGSISLDRTVYPVPFGVPADFGGAGLTSTPADGTTERSVFPIHQSGMNGAGISTQTSGLDTGEYLASGDLTIHVRINDPDFDISASGEDSIAADTAADDVGPVKISVIRGSDTVVLTYAGGPASEDGLIDVGDNTPLDAPEFGPIAEIAPDAGIFEADIIIRYTDGPASPTCPDTSDFTSLNGTAGTGEDFRFNVPSAGSSNYCILQGDILQVQYTDPADASGDVNTVTDSATFDLRNGVLQSDKSVYIIGSDMILTLIEPDLDLDNDQAETYDLDLIEWDSDAATLTMGDADGEGLSFDPEPLNFRETGDSTGIFQIVIEIPQELDNDSLERGEEIILEYTDWGPSGSDYVGDEDEDVNVTIFTSNFGATVELDQKVYSWTDKVYITIVAPDHNFDGDLIDEIGNTETDPIKVSTRGFDIDQYKLVETGTDTGIFTGEVILTGFLHDADGEAGDDTNPRTSGSGPTDGFLQTDDDDGLTVSFEFSEDETVVGSSLIRWNIGEVQWLEASYPASGTGVVRIIDPDMNLDPEAVDNFDADIWSDSDAGGIDLTVTETNEATGIFEGTVFFTTTDESSGHRLRVAEGDTVTAEYEDNTLPDPYTTADELDITATTLIGTVVPPLERAPAANLRTVDAFGNSLDTVSVDQQVQISADLANGQDREQAFAYLVQIQDGNGVTVSLAWITGSLSSGQSFSPALSWIPTEAGTYTATAFVWESIDNPTALSPPVSTTVTVQ